MRMDVPGKLERAVVKASDIGTETRTDDERTAQEFRDDSPFSQSKPQSNETAIEDTIQWLHDQGYRFTDIYQLLIGEIEALSEGFERKQKRQEEKQPSRGGSGTQTSYGAKRDRAAELGWR